MFRVFLFFLRTIAAFLLVLAAMTIVSGFVLTWMVRSSVDQRVFKEGSLPSPAPIGTTTLSEGGIFPSWKGKEFSASGTGVDLIESNNTLVPSAVFYTSVNTGIFDTETSVLQMNYNDARNPLWLRPVLQEIVQIGSGTYLGKIHVRLVPLYPFTIGYFKLTTVR